MTAPRLDGAGVLVTRPAQHAAELMAEIVRAGGKPLAFPVLDIEPLAGEVVAAARATLAAPDIAIFVSRNAVEHGLHMLDGSNARIAAVGPATAAALAARGRPATILPASGFDSEALLEQVELRDVANLRVRIVRGNGGRELLADTLESRGARVDCLAVYRRVAHRHDAAALRALARRFREGGVQYVLAMSVASLEFLLQVLPAECRAALPRTRLVTPSERVIITALERVPGMRALLAASPAAPHLVAAMLASQPNPPALHG